MGHGLTASARKPRRVLWYRNSRRADKGLEATLVEMDGVVAAEIGAESFVTGQLADHRTRGRCPAYAQRRASTTSAVPCPDGCRGRPMHPLLTRRPLRGPDRLAEVALHPGDVVVFHTDGITDARDAQGNLYGRERLATRIAAAMKAGALPPEILRVVVRDVLQFQDDRAQDDASLILASWRPARRENPTWLRGRTP